MDGDDYTTRLRPWPTDEWDPAHIPITRRTKWTPIMTQVSVLVPRQHHSISGLVVKSIVAIDGPRVRFTADA
ncbi:hypothetical protein GGR58DRAFT_484151, partial [Xylaria digitata]